MTTFYKPGIFEIILHGVFKRHSWFMERFITQEQFGSKWSYKCRICLIDQPEGTEPSLQNELLLTQRD